MSSSYRMYQIDAFSQQIFGGNPAAVVPLESWLSDEIMQKVANENNLAETAFFVANDKGYHLRWFTPAAEVRLCGHATLATAHVLFAHLDYPKEEIIFETLSGPLFVKKTALGYQMNFPADFAQPDDQLDLIAKATGEQALATYRGKDDWLAIFPDEATITRIQPDQLAVANLPGRGLIVSAPGEEVDFVSRCFYPKYGIPEDPTTGSAHCLMTPYWANKLGKNQLSARQISARVGDLQCQLVDDRVLLEGQAQTYMIGEFWTS